MNPYTNRLTAVVQHKFIGFDDIELWLVVVTSRDKKNKWSFVELLKTLRAWTDIDINCNLTWLTELYIHKTERISAV